MFSCGFRVVRGRFASGAVDTKRHFDFGFASSQKHLGAQKPFSNKAPFLGGYSIRRPRNKKKHVKGTTGLPRQRSKRDARLGN